MVLTTLITFIIIFGLLIFLHELGHFLMARKFGVRVEEFGFGLPPRIVGIVKGGKGWEVVKGGKELKATIYSLNWIPFGGFVKLFGEEDGFNREPDSFSAKGKMPRAIILTAGVAMNVFFTVMLLSMGFMVGTPSVIDEDISPRATLSDVQVQIVDVVEGSPAAAAGIAVGDTILSLNAAQIASIREFQSLVQSLGDTPFTLQIQKSNGEVKELSLSAAHLPEGEGKAIIGVGLIRTGVVSYPWYLAIPEGLRSTVELGLQLLKAFGRILVNLLTTGRTDAVVSGPIGIAVLTGQVVNLGVLYVLQFTATLSLNLAILNYLPFPALDGGRVLFILVEAIRGKAVSKKFEAALHTVGFALLIILIIFITYRDIARYGQGILEALRKAIT